MKEIYADGSSKALGTQRIGAWGVIAYEKYDGELKLEEIERIEALLAEDIESPMYIDIEELKKELSYQPKEQPWMKKIFETIKK